MSAMQRRKGHGYERSVVAMLRERGIKCQRNLDQVRDGGGDIPCGDWLIECKRRQKIAVYEWMDQAILAAAVDPAGRKPVLAIRADRREDLAVMRFSDFMDLISPTPPSTEGRSLPREQG